MFENKYPGLKYSLTMIFSALSIISKSDITFALASIVSVLAIVKYVLEIKEKFANKKTT